MTRTALVHPDSQSLAHAAAARFITKLIDLQSETHPIHVALTGGTIGIATLAAVAANPAHHAVDWSGVHLWWGDERLLPAGDPNRNDTQAYEALLNDIPHAHCHPAPDHGTPDEAAAAYAKELPERFHLTLLGVGPDGHVASLFPGQDALHADGTVVGVSDSPKPPPERVSLTMPMINSSDEVWLLVSGSEKAAALRDPSLPVAQVSGAQRTLLLCDVAAASDVQK